MIAPVVITPWHWAGFIGAVLLFLSLDLGVFHRRAHVVKFGEALAWTTIWFLLAMVFAFAFVAPNMGEQKTVVFLTGYITELSLSMDNVFVIALIFAYFRVPVMYQHRVLFWGILGALVMRGAMILAGAALINRFQWTLYLFALFLIYTGVKMIFSRAEGIEPERNPVVRLARKCYPVSNEFNGQKFTVPSGAVRALTPLAVALLMIETVDLVFALDSIPAIFGFTTDPFIVFTSNVFAILGLRSLYFVLANAIGYFRFLKVGLSVVLVFIGIKMLLAPHAMAERKFWFQVDLEPTVSLAIVASIIFVSILTSVVVAWQEKSGQRSPPR
jgi:TerC family integral membrane protein